MTVLRNIKPGNSNVQICFTKQELVKRFAKETLSRKVDAQNARIHRALKTGILLSLKNGLYITSEFYLNESNKIQLTEYIASVLYAPSYISGEYVLRQYGMLLYKNGQNAVTCISKKSNRLFENQLGIYAYQNIRSPSHDRIKNVGIQELKFCGNAYRIATKARALFDYIYLYHGLMHRNQVQLKRQLINGLDIQWGNFTDTDFQEFDQCVCQSNSKKMMRVITIIHNYLEERKPNAWLENLLEL